MTIASVIDKINDKLAESDQPSATTIEGALKLLLENIGNGGGGDLPVATASTLGGIKVGDNLSITEGGVLSASGGGGGGGVFWVTFADGEDDSVVADKTYAEIAAAYNAGAYIIGRYGEESDCLVYNLSEAAIDDEEGGFIFSYMRFTSASETEANFDYKTINVSADGTVAYYDDNFAIPLS